MGTRLADGRREELLDGVMRIISARGFADVRISEIARELHCSVSTLYKIAPSKDSLVLRAIGQWGDINLADFESRAQKKETATDRARTYFRAGAHSVQPMSPAYFRDVQRFESTRVAWVAIVDQYIYRFVELVEAAQAAGEVGPVNTRFLGEMLRQVGLVTRDQGVLSACGMTSEQAVLAVDHIVWDGIRRPQTAAATQGG